MKRRKSWIGIVLALALLLGMAVPSLHAKAGGTLLAVTIEYVTEEGEWIDTTGLYYQTSVGEFQTPSDARKEVSWSSYMASNRYFHANGGYMEIAVDKPVDDAASVIGTYVLRNYMLPQGYELAEAPDVTVEVTQQDVDEYNSACKEGAGSVCVPVTIKLRPSGNNSKRDIPVSEIIVRKSADHPFMLDPAGSFVYVNDVFALEAQVKPEEAADKSFVWTSSDESVATVSEDGTVVARKKGKTTITAVPNNPSDTFRYTVTNDIDIYVSDRVDLPEHMGWQGDTFYFDKVDRAAKYTLRLFTSSGSSSQSEDQTIYLNADDATQQFSYDFSDLFALDEDSSVYVPNYHFNRNEVSVILDVYGQDGSRGSSSEKIPYGSQVNGLAVTGIYMNASRTMPAETTEKLTAVPVPLKATNTTLHWSSSNENVATVDHNGQVAAITEGTAVITAAATDGSGVTASCTVTVTKKTQKETGVSRIDLVPTVSHLKAGDTTQVTAFLAPNEASDQGLVWMSSAPDVATVDQDGNVSALTAGTVSITAEAKDGYGQVGSCVLTVEGGSEDNHGGETSSFLDVPADSWYAAPVQWALAKGITSGVGNGLFGAQQTVTRAQFVTWLYKLSGSPASDTLVTFTDVAADKYYAPAVSWAVANQITAGTGNNQFEPNKKITREQAMTFLWRYAGSPAATQNKQFSDVKTGAYYEQAVAWAAGIGATAGKDDGTFGVGSNCTRAQSITFLWRAEN